MRGEASDLAQTLTGERNKELNNAALKLGTLVAIDALTEGEVIGALYDASKANGLVADHGQRAALATINSGLRKGLETPRVIPELTAKPHDETKPVGEKPAEPVSEPEIFWHGTHYQRELRPWLIKELIPQQGQGLASGQWGTGKTFAVIDLAASIITGTPFADHEVCRSGGVLFVAAEGANEIPIRLQGVVDQKLRLNPALGAADLDKLPFAWIEECPSLKEEHSFERLVGLALAADKKMKEQFNVDLALIIIDTLSAAADFVDANDAAEGQRIMNRLNALSRRTGAFALAVDHFGKDASTGTRGSSAKEAAADVVLALLADRDVNGTIKNTRLAVRKLRGGATGAETPFDLKEVELGTPGVTTCIIEWKPGLPLKEGPTDAKPRWPKGLRIFRQALLTALIDAGDYGVPFYDGPKVKWVPDYKVKAEFMAAYPSDSDTEEKKKGAKRAAWTRGLNKASEMNLIGTRFINGFDYLWVVVDE
jgi:AAA domain